MTDEKEEEVEIGTLSSFSHLLHDNYLLDFIIPYTTFTLILSYHESTRLLSEIRTRAFVFIFERRLSLLDSDQGFRFHVRTKAFVVRFEPRLSFSYSNQGFRCQIRTKAFVFVFEPRLSLGCNQVLTQDFSEYA